jgi:transcriptional regulator with XRE-family HTH domain
MHRALRRLRKTLQLTQLQAAAKTGFAQETISAWENGRRPTDKNLAKYLSKLDCSREQLKAFQIETLREELGSSVAPDIEVAFNERLNRVQKILNERASEFTRYDYYTNQLRRCGILWTLCLEGLEDIEKIIEEKCDIDASETASGPRSL